MLPSQVVYQNKDDQVTVVAAGVTLHEALAAAEYLKKGTGWPQRLIYIPYNINVN